MAAVVRPVAFNSIILEEAEKHLGVEEWPGAKHNPAVLAYFEASGNAWVKDDETPWCAAFVNAILAILGLPTNGKLNARSFLEYGEPVSLANVRPGDIVVFWRGSPNGWQGHVGIVVSINGDKVMVLGGNQGNKVSIAPYPMSRVLGFRRVTGIPAANEDDRPTIREGDRGQFVSDLQTQLRDLRFFLGRVDGHFGPITTKAVVSFQALNDLKADGIVGPKTWDALKTAEPKPDRDVTTEDLRESGSRTIETADEAETVVKGGAGAVVGLGTVEVAIEAVENFSGAGDALSAAQVILLENWLVLLVIGTGVVAYFWGGRIMDRIRTIRTDDARTGANLKR